MADKKALIVVMTFLVMFSLASATDYGLTDTSSPYTLNYTDPSVPNWNLTKLNTSSETFSASWSSSNQTLIYVSIPKDSTILGASIAVNGSNTHTVTYTLNDSLNNSAYNSVTSLISGNQFNTSLQIWNKYNGSTNSGYTSIEMSDASVVPENVTVYYQNGSVIPHKVVDSDGDSKWEIVWLTEEVPSATYDHHHYPTDTVGDPPSGVSAYLESADGSTNYVSVKYTFSNQPYAGYRMGMYIKNFSTSSSTPSQQSWTSIFGDAIKYSNLSSGFTDGWVYYPASGSDEFGFQYYPWSTNGDYWVEWNIRGTEDTKAWIPHDGSLTAGTCNWDGSGSCGGDPFVYVDLLKAGEVYEWVTYDVVYLDNFTVDIGRDGIVNALIGAVYNSSHTISNTTDVQTYLASCSAGSDGFCDVPINISSESGGDFRIDNINITWKPDASNWSHLIDYVDGTSDCTGGASCTRISFNKTYLDEQRFANFTIGRVFLDNQSEVEGATAYWDDLPVTVANESDGLLYVDITDISLFYRSNEENHTIWTAGMGTRSLSLSPISWTVSTTSSSSLNQEFKVSVSGSFNATSCNMSAGSLGSYASFNESDFDVAVGDTSAVLVTFTDVPVGSYSTNVTSTCTVNSAETKSASVLTLTSTASSASTSGGGGGSTTIVGNASFSLKTERGGDAYSLRVGRGAERVKLIVIESVSSDVLDVSLSCVGIESDNVCGWVELDKEEVSLKPRETENVKMTVSVPEDAESGAYAFAITGVDEDGLGDTIKVTVVVGGTFGSLSDLINKLDDSLIIGHPFDESASPIVIPYGKAFLSSMSAIILWFSGSFVLKDSLAGFNVIMLFVWFFGILWML